MALFERLQVGLSDLPVSSWTGVELAGAIHGQPSRFVLHDQPFHPIDIRETVAEIVRVVFEDRPHVRLIALQSERSGADGGLDFLEVAVFLSHFWGDDPHTHGVGQDVEQPDEGFFEDELHRIAVHHLYPVHRVQNCRSGLPFSVRKRS